MITLSSVTDKLQVVLSGSVAANQMACYASFKDTKSGQTLIPDRSVALTNNTTAVDVVGAPAANIQRGIDEVSVVNSDTSAGEVTVRYNADGTVYSLAKFTLAAGEKLEYTTQNGWRVLATSGAVKQSINQGNSPVSSDLNRVVLASDVINNNAVANTIADVTGLSFPVVSGLKYYFKFWIAYTSAATATGSRWAINGPSLTSLSLKSEYSLTATTQTVNAVSGYDLPAAANATSAATTTGNWAVLEGIIQCSADGSVIARFASEITASAITAKAGSFVEYIQLT